MRRRLAPVSGVLLLALAGAAAAQTAPGGPSRGPDRGGGGSSSGGGSVAVPIPEPGAIARRWLRPEREMLVAAVTDDEARPVLAALEDRDYTRVRRSRLGALGLELVVLQGPRRADLLADAEALGQLHPAVSLGPNLRYARLGTEAGAGSAGPTPRTLVGAGAPDPACGRGLRLGMLDLLPDANARPLRGAALEVRRIVPWGHRLAGGDHGTAVAGLLVGRADDERLAGLAPGAALAAAGIFARARNGDPEATTEWIAQGLDWVLGQGADVVNLSFGGPPDAVLARVVTAALARGAALVAAAGNDGPEAPPPHPAALEGVLAVTAVDVALEPWPRATRGAHVALAAPGVDVFTAGGKHRSGTSYATPFATVALAFERARGLQDADARVLAAARDLGPPGVDPIFGAGLVQLAAACGR